MFCLSIAPENPRQHLRGFFSKSTLQRLSLLGCSWMTSLVLLAFLLAAQPAANAQVPQALQLATPQADPPQEEEGPSLADWRKDVRERLNDAKLRSKELRTDGEVPLPATLKRQIELLSRVDTVLAQLAAEEEVTKKNQIDSKNLQDETNDFLQHGFSETQRITFLQLDEARDDLQDEQRRLARLTDEEKSATLSLEKAEQDFKNRSSARRLLREKVASNDQDALRQKLGEKLAEIVLLCEVSKANRTLRKKEAENAAQEVQLEKLRVGLFKEKVARMQTRAIFGSPELNELLEKIDRQEIDLDKDISELEADQTKLKYLLDQWMRAQRQLDESTGNKEALHEEVASHQLGRRVIQERLPLLLQQKKRLAAIRDNWQRRQSVFNSRATREETRKWIVESEDSLAQLNREERTSNFEIEELNNLLGPLKERQQSVAVESPEAYWIEQQIGNLQVLVESQKQNASNILASKKLHQKLLDELESDSLADTAKNRISDLKNLVSKIWNFELAVFGEKENERSVTVQKVVTALLILFAGLFISRSLSRALRKQVLRRLDFDPSASATIQSLFYYTLLLMFALFALNVAKVPLTAFTVLGGAVALGVGFGSQNIINNFISGLVMMAERPVKVGDLVQIDDLYGNIEHIGARSTRIRTGANLEIIVPNSSFLQNNVINFTLSSNKVRTFVEVGVVYGSPTVTVTQLLRRAAVETGRVAKDPPPIILFKGFGDSSLQFEVHFWIHMRTMMDQLQIESAVRFRIDQLFREEGIVIAFPQRDVHLDTSSPLTVEIIESSTD